VIRVTAPTNPIDPAVEVSSLPLCFLRSPAAVDGQTALRETAFLLPINEYAPAAARRRIGAAEGPASEGEALLDALRLVASELVSNAVEHSDPAPGGALFLALVHAPGQVLLAVTDPGSNGGTTPHLRRTDWDAEGGRGLHLVDRCSAYWGVVVAPGATTVWARLSS